jgi:hypothetical protein
MHETRDHGFESWPSHVRTSPLPIFSIFFINILWYRVELSSSTKEKYWYLMFYPVTKTREIHLVWRVSLPGDEDARDTSGLASETCTTQPPVVLRTLAGYI